MMHIHNKILYYKVQNRELFFMFHIFAAVREKCWTGKFFLCCVLISQLAAVQIKINYTQCAQYVIHSWCLLGSGLFLRGERVWNLKNVCPMILGDIIWLTSCVVY